MVMQNTLNTIDAMRRRRQGGAVGPSLTASGAMAAPVNPMTGVPMMPPPINVPTLPMPASPMAASSGQMYGPAMQARNFMLDRGDGAPLLPYLSKTGAAPNIPGMTAIDVGPVVGPLGEEAPAAAAAPAGGAVEGLMGGALMDKAGNFRGLMPMLFGPSLSMAKDPGEFTGLVPGLFSGLSGLFGGE